MERALQQQESLVNSVTPTPRPHHRCESMIRSGFNPSFVLLPLRDRYDWTTGGTGQRKRLEEVPRRTSLAPLAFPCLYFV